MSERKRAYSFLTRITRTSNIMSLSLLGEQSPLSFPLPSFTSQLLTPLLRFSFNPNPTTEGVVIHCSLLKIKMIKGQLTSEIFHHRPDLEKIPSTNQINLDCKFSVYISLYSQILPLSSLPINRLVN
jgi:hypothetical protein